MRKKICYIHTYVLVFMKHKAVMTLLICTYGKIKTTESIHVAGPQQVLTVLLYFRNHDLAIIQENLNHKSCYKRLLHQHVKTGPEQFYLWDLWLADTQSLSKVGIHCIAGFALSFRRFNPFHRTRLHTSKNKRFNYSKLFSQYHMQ